LSLIPGKETGTGEGTLTPVRASGSLVVKNKKVAQFLETLHEARRLQGLAGPTQVREPKPRPVMTGAGGFSGVNGGGAIGGGFF
jgi:hypothetical protein